MVKRMIVKVDEKSVQAAENVLRPVPKVPLKLSTERQKSRI